MENLRSIIKRVAKVERRLAETERARAREAVATLETDAARVAELADGAEHDAREARADPKRLRNLAPQAVGFRQVHAELLAELEVARGRLAELEAATPETFPNGRRAWAFEVHCAACGHPNTHQGRVTVYDPDHENTADGVTVIVQASQAVMTSGTTGNPSRRRQGLVIDIHCEYCDEVSRLAIYQHKGFTLTEYPMASEAGA